MEASMAQIVDALAAQIAVLNRDGDIVDTNRAWKVVADKGGLRADGRAGLAWNYLEECLAAAGRGCAEAGEVALGIARVLGGEADLFVGCYSCPFDGVHHWYQVMVTPAPPGGPRGGAVVMHTDVTAIQHDPLTGLANRALFDAQLELTLAQAGRSALTAGVILIDLDRFKPVNDELGHQAGDRVLVEAARRLRGCLRAGDLPARLGGDEFAVVLGPTVEARPGEAVAARLVDVLGEPYRLGGRTLAVGASAGLALWPAHARTAEALVERADRALYAAKAAGRACCRVAEAA
jgi:diguanylate cyclase (GGDEF)-like protein